MSVQIEKVVFNIGGLQVNAFTKAGLLGSSDPLVALIALHGRLGNSGHMESTARDMIKWAEEKRHGEYAAQRDLVVITLDQRNHGHRMVDPLGNEGWSNDPANHNERHAIDMYSIQTGTAKDVSFVMDFLPAYLFPNDERTISDWAVMGVSLGGHATWLSLKDEPRARIGIPVIGCPDYLTLMQLRADKSGFPFGPPYMPESLRSTIKRSDPPHTPFKEPSMANPFYGKKILVLSGADDPLVQWSASRTFIEALEVGQDGRKSIMLMEGVKHEYTEVMKQKAFEFIWEEALLVQKSSL